MKEPECELPVVLERAGDQVRDLDKIKVQEPDEVKRREPRLIQL